MGKTVDCEELQPGDHVLVRNTREQGGPGKLRSYWEPDIYIILNRKENRVVYEVQKLSCGRGEKRTLHRNMLLPCDLLEVPIGASNNKKQTTKPIQNYQRQPRRLSQQKHQQQYRKHQNELSTLSNTDNSSEEEEFDLLPVPVKPRKEFMNHSQGSPVQRPLVDIPEHSKVSVVPEHVHDHDHRIPEERRKLAIVIKT